MSFEDSEFVEPVDSQSGSGVWRSARSYLHRVARLKLKDNNRFDRSDIVQQTLLEVQQQPAESIPEEPVIYRRWLRKILLHNMLDALRESRRKKRDVRREIYIDRFESSEAGLPADAMVADQSSPSQGASRNEKNSEVRGIVASLPEDNRLVIEMRFFEHLEIPEIALKLERNEAAVSSLLYRSIQLLKEKMTKQSIPSDTSS